MTETDNIIYERFNVKEERERIFLAGEAEGYRFGYRVGHADGKNERTGLGDFAMRCLTRSSGAQEMVRVHEMREAYWR